MVTSLVEQNKIKCHEYFPQLNSQMKFVNIDVTCASQKVFPTFVKSILVVERVSIIKYFWIFLIDFEIAE